MKRIIYSLLVVLALLFATWFIHGLIGLDGLDCSPNCVNQASIDLQQKFAYIIGPPVSLAAGLLYYKDHKSK